MRYACRFEPWGLEASVEEGTTVLDAARQCGLPLEARCGGKRSCGTCAVKVLEGTLAEPNDEERAIIKSGGFRLGCRARIISNVVVQPLVGQASRPPKEVPVPAGAGEGETQRAVVGFDIGTTTIKAALKLEDDRTFFAQSANSQSLWGADVLSRLAAAANDRTTARSLQSAVQKDLLKITDELVACAQEVHATPQFTNITFAANTIMAALLCGAYLEQYLKPPYGSDENLIFNQGEFYDSIMKRYPSCTFFVLPTLGHLVGGDITADVYAHGGFDPRGASEGDRPFLIVDMGTNIEAVVVTDEKLFVGSAPAGSAFSFEGTDGLTALENLVFLKKQGALQDDGLLKEEHPIVHRDSEGILHARARHGEVSQLDIRSFQLAKAAMSVCVDKVVKASGVSPNSFSRIILCGILGDMVADCIEPLALIERNILAHNSIEFAPQSALQGALKFARNNEHELLKSKEVVALNFAQDPDFINELLAHLTF